MNDTSPPKAIKVFHRQWDIVAIPEAWMTDDRGWADLDRALIGYCDSLSGPALKEVILHELIHAINHALNIKDGATEEDITHKLAVGLRTVFIDNPKFAAWISS